MKAMKRKGFVFGVMVLVSGIGSAQTVNTGDLFIGSGTIVSTMASFDNQATADLVNDGDLLVYSHFNNDGLVAFTPGVSTGMTRLYGENGTQDVSGNLPMEWNNVEFKNDKVESAFNLTSEIKIFGHAFFEKGIVEVDERSGLVVFEDDAQHFNASNSSYVQGEVRNVGDDVFEFPVGANGYYRHAALSAPNNRTDVFNAKYVMSNSGVLHPHSNKSEEIVAIDIAEYWTVSRVSGKSDVMLTLSWNEQTTDAAILDGSLDNIVIVRWDASQNIWVNQGGVADPSLKTVTMVLDPLEAYGVFTLGKVKKGVDKPEDSIVVYNGVSTNDDGHNDYFKITGLEKFVNNKVQVFNRWGVKVYETTNYDTNGNVFKGYSEGRTTIDKNEKLPDGTYFYTINASNPNGQNFKKAGYLYIND